MPALASWSFVFVLGLAGELRRETWPDGKPRAEYEVELRGGRELRSGPFRAWHENGALASEGSFAQDLETGRWKLFHADGTPAAEGAYARGERTGVWETFHPGGKRASKGKYEKNRRTGEWTFWDASGAKDALHSGAYANLEHRARDGSLVHGATLDGAFHGDWSGRWPDGAPQWNGRFERGQRVGTWTFLHPDGTPSPVLSARYASGRDDAAPALGEPSPGAPAAAPGAHAPIEADPLGWPADGAALAAELETWSRLGETELAERRLALGREGRRPAWLEAGTRALPIVLRALPGCDPEVAEERARLARIEALALRPLCAGRVLLALPSDRPPDVSEARAFVREWSSLWAATRFELWFWRIEVPFAPLEQSEPLCSAALAFEHRLAPAPAPPALYARRFEPREKTPHSAAVAAALAWLERAQRPDGRWEAGYPAHRIAAGLARGEHFDPGVTALGALALLAAGRTPRDSDALLVALAWLVARQDARGRVMHGPHHDWIYGHALTTLALCEALSVHPSETLRPHAQRLTDVLLEAQNPRSGWGYDLPPSGERDTSVTA